VAGAVGSFRNIPIFTVIKVGERLIFECLKEIIPRVTGLIMTPSQDGCVVFNGH